MIIRNLIILLIDLGLGIFWALESKYAYLGNLFIEPYRSWMAVFCFVLILLWTLLSILILRRWGWASLGLLLTFIAYGAVTFLFPPTADLFNLVNYSTAFAAVLLSVFLVSFYAEHAAGLLGYMVQARKHQVTVQTAAGPFWFLFALILGFLNALALYYGWLPTASITFLGSPQIFRLSLYLLFATLGGLLTLSTGWSTLASFSFVFLSEFLTLFLYTTYASFSQLGAELAGVFVDPARVTLPALMVLLSTLWGLAAGYYAQRYFFLKEGKRAGELEKLELTAKEGELAVVSAIERIPASQIPPEIPPTP